MATVKKGAKIDFYKFVDPNKGSSTTSRANARGGNKELTSVLKTQTQAINNMGRVVNSIGSTVVSVKDAQMKLLKIDEERLKRASFVPKYTKKQPMGKMKVFDSLFKGKLPGFFESLIKLASSLLKFFLVLPALKWLSNPENQDKVVSGLKVLAKVFKFIADVAKFSFVNTIEGLYDLLKEDATWMERIGGFTRALAGLGTAWLAIGILTNPLATVNAFKGVLLFMNKGLMAAAVALARHPLVAMAGGAVIAAKYLPQLFPDNPVFGVDRDDRAELENLEETGQTKEERILELKEEKEQLNFFQRLIGRDKQIDELIYFLETGKTKSYGFAEGGWISGPQSGYPVSLGGNSADFIGHGTEYVARKGKDAFIVPFDTPATKKDPTLTGQRMQEASALGFFSEGGTYDEFARSMIKIHEGFHPKAYPDTLGNMTIGYGHLIKPNESFPDGISRARAQELFEKDYTSHKKGAQRIPGYGKSSPQQKAGLIDLTYNQGVGWHRGFPKFMAAYKKGDYETAGAELKDSQWYGQVGRRAPTIVNLIKNKGLGNGVGQYLLDEGLVVPTADKMSSKGFDWTFGLSQFFSGAPAAASTLDSTINENRRDGMETNTKSDSYRVVPTSHADTGSGWGIEGVTDKFGRPLVFSQPAAQMFAKMMKASNGMVKGSDVASSGRSPSKNKEVDGHKNSVHLYGEGIDISGSSNAWMKNNASRFGWNYGYSHGPGSGHYDYKGEGAGKTPILGKAGSSSYSFMDLQKENAGRKFLASTSLSGLNLFGNNNDQPGSGRPFTDMFSEGTFGNMGDFFTTQGYQPNIFNSQNRTRFAQNNSEQIRVKKVTEQRNQARREINAKTSEIVQMALAAVEAQNGSNRQFISTAESAIRSLLGAQQGGGTFANVGGTTGTVLRTAVAVLNSFNNPLRGIFQ